MISSTRKMRPLAPLVRMALRLMAWKAVGGVWRARREGAYDDFQGSLVGDVALALPVGEFGQDSEILGLAKEIHSARRLHARGERWSRNCPDGRIG